ncbi:NACHT domain-containing protein [Streptomyces sp900116325]|uniref:NACHT domain-containing protein n=1 Tax=Streptomyces sp. 900116325 TaxID=3154295 RepID=UPI0033BA400F
MPRGPEAGMPGGTFRGPVVLSVRLGVFVFAVVLLVARPALPLPRGYDFDAVQAGWLLIVGTLALEAGVRVRQRMLRRRREAWLSEQSLRRATEELAEELSFVYGQDERWKQVHDPEPLDVAWRVLNGSPDLQLSSPGGYFTRTTGQRLVVLGGAGAGKSVLVLRLAHELLEERVRTGKGPVPVLASLASWDPRQGLFSWMAERLADEHPGACTPVTGAPAAEVAFTLLRTRRVLPILDGFDELPAGVRHAAMRELMQSLRGGYRFVLTSREPEYLEYAPDHSVFAREEIVLCPLAYEAVAAYLNPGGRPETRWSGVLARLGDTADRTPEVARLRKTLRVPLMATLAKVAYARDGADPGKLLERGRFVGQPDIERHLYDAFLDAVYGSSHDDRVASGGWAPERARAWAGFLSAHMKRRHQQDLAWWRLDEHVPAAVRVLGIVPAYLLSVALVAWLGFGKSRLWWDTWEGVSLWGAYAVVCGLAFLHACLSVKVDWGWAPRLLVRPTVRQVRKVWGRRSYRIAALLIAVGGGTGWAVGTDRRLLGAMGGLIAAVAGWRTLVALWPQADPFLARSPAALLRSDRTAVVGLGWLAPLRESSALVVQLAVLCLPPVFLSAWSVTRGQDVVSGGAWAVTVVGTLTSWLLYAVAVSAWGRYTVARLYLAAAGRLPLRFMTFLEDAHRRGVLRQSGGVYRFRHIELRDRLAQTAQDRMIPRPKPPRRLSRAVSEPLGVAASIAVLAMLPGGCDPRTLPGPVQALPRACSLLDVRDVEQLTDHAAKRTSAARTPSITDGNRGLPRDRGHRLSCGGGQRS